ncbi:nucleotidyltransferase family protein [Brevibacillus sp. H7]|uniref:nucleotidyltransferase family protein n=1 Tax=Brevibacillus sp. H7 TaxID=3349138 RepID=UPI0037F30951
MKPVCACILAAGMSTRMGKSKQLLDWNGSYLLEHVVHRVLLYDFSHVFAIIGHDAERIQDLIRIRDPRFQWVRNESYLSGQSTSVRLGLDRAVDQQAAVMVFPGDLPLWKEETVKTILHSGKDLLETVPSPFVVQPVFREKPGHPVFFGNVQKGLYDRLDGDQGMKPIIRTMNHQIRIAVEDEGIVLDIDTPQIYEDLKKNGFSHADGGEGSEPFTDTIRVRRR